MDAEREKYIRLLSSQGHSTRDIAARLYCSQSTVSRALRKPEPLHDGGFDWLGSAGPPDPHRVTFREIYYRYRDPVPPGPAVAAYYRTGRRTMSKNFACPARDGDGERVHGKAPAVAWLAIREDAEGSRANRPWCKPCLATGTVEEHAAAIMRYYAGPQHSPSLEVVTASVKEAVANAWLLGRKKS